MRTINQRYRLYLFLVAVLLGAVAAGYLLVVQIWRSPLGDLVRLVNTGKPIRTGKLESAVERASAYFEGVPPDVDAQLNYLRDDLGKLADKAQTQFQGGRLYTYAFYGYTLINTCMLEPADQKR
ncbi:MAG: hypothetical protein HY318_11970, partial [Armatimonadetes bacterium]|nr:hypothetical protein [Armatimonadota bacterium]